MEATPTATLMSALATVLSSPPGGTISFPRVRVLGINLSEWCKGHGLRHFVSGRTVTLTKTQGFGWLRMDFAAAFSHLDLTAYMDGRFCDYEVEHQYQAWTKAGREGAAL